METEQVDNAAQEIDFPTLCRGLLSWTPKQERVTSIGSSTLFHSRHSPTGSFCQ